MNKRLHDEHYFLTKRPINSNPILRTGLLSIKLSLFGNKVYETQSIMLVLYTIYQFTQVSKWEYRHNHRARGRMPHFPPSLRIETEMQKVETFCGNKTILVGFTDNYAHRSFNFDKPMSRRDATFTLLVVCQAHS